jgi:hypothetical protein
VCAFDEALVSHMHLTYETAGGTGQPTPIIRDHRCRGQLAGVDVGASLAGLGGRGRVRFSILVRARIPKETRHEI